MRARRWSRFSRRPVAAAIAAVALMLAAGLPTAPASAGVSTPAAAALTVTPDTLLLNNQFVTVAGTGYPAGTQVAMAQCKPAPVDSGGCDISTTNYVTTDGAGAFSVGFKVKRVIRVGAETIDCATAGACIVGAGVLPDGDPGAGAPIQFDPDQPLPPPPSLTVDPDSDLVDRQAVTVTGNNYEPFSSVGVVQCRAPSNGAADCDLATLRFVPPDENGDFTSPFVVRRLIVVAGQTLDCAEPGLCEIGAGSTPDLGAQAPISFDPDAPLAPPPVATVDPATGLTDGESVAVSGSGFEPLNSVTLIQCEFGGPPDSTGCDLSSLSTAPTDESGGFATTFRVQARLDTASGPVDCTAAPGACMLAVVWPGDITTAVITRLSFGSDPPVPNGEPGNPPASTPLVTPRFTG